MQPHRPLVQEDRGHHCRDRRHRLPDQHPGTERPWKRPALESRGAVLWWWPARCARWPGVGRGRARGQGADFASVEAWSFTRRWWTAPADRAGDRAVGCSASAASSRKSPPARPNKSRDMQQVNTAVGELEQMTQQNAAPQEQSAAAAGAMSEQAAVLERLVGRFRLADAPLVRLTAG